MKVYGYTDYRDTDLFPFIWFRSSTLTFCEGVGKSFWIHINEPIIQKDKWFNLSNDRDDIVVFNNPFRLRNIAIRRIPE